MDAGHSKEEVQAWLGHKSIKSTDIYARISDARRDKLARMIESEEHITTLDKCAQGHLTQY